MRALLLSFLMGLSLATPAFGSTLPRVDFEQHRGMVSLGLLDANLDGALTERMSLGVSVSSAFPYLSWGPRLTYRLGETVGGLSYGFTLSAGAVRMAFADRMGATGAEGSGFWAQPALNLALPLGGKGSPWMLRGTVGPVWTYRQPALLLNWPLVPNLELAYRFPSAQELTLGGNSLLGWRGIF